MNSIPEERQLDPRYGNPDRKSTANDSDGREDFQRQGPSKNSMSHRSDEIVEARQMSHKQPQFRDEYYKDAMEGVWLILFHHSRSHYYP